MVHAWVLSSFGRVWLFVTLWTLVCQASLSMGFSRQEYRNGLLCPPPRDFPDPGVKPASPKLPTLQTDSLPLSHRGRPKKMWYIYTMEYHSIIKNKEIMTFVATWMDLEIVILSEIYQRKTNTIWYHLHVESFKMTQINLLTKQKQSHRYRRQTHGYQRGKVGGGKINWEFGIDMYMLLLLLLPSRLSRVRLCATP